MEIEIDREESPDGRVLARHVIHTDRAPWNKVLDPRDNTKTMDVIDFILLCNGNVALQHTAGYDVQSQLIGELAPRSRWQRVVDGSKHPNADPAIAGKLG